MLDHLADVSVRSLALALAAAIVLWILRSRRTAALQHAVWAAVVYGMLVLFVFGQALPRLPLRILHGPAVVLPAAEPTRGLVLDEAPPTVTSRPLADKPTQDRGQIGWKNIMVYAYSAIVFALMAHFLMGMFLVRKLLATAHSIPNVGNRVFESGVIAVPVTAGWLRPRILLPLEWREWDREKLDAVLAHEGAHASRHDGLVGALAGLNRCIFWFHPLAWMLESKLGLLAEQACDECSVATLGDRKRYADLLLEMAMVVDEAHGRLRRHALTMAAGSHIRQRIDALLQEGRIFTRGLTWMGWASVVLSGIPVVLVAGGVELDRRPQALTLAVPRWNAPVPQLSKKLPEQKLTGQEPMLLAQTRTAKVQGAAPQSPAAASPKFDAISVRPCLVGDGNGRAGRGGGGGRGIPISPPGELYVNCMSVWELVNHYVEVGDAPLLNNARWTPFDTERVRGGSAWLYSDLYTIDARTDDPVANGPNVGLTPANKLLNGPMLQALIEDRFHLKAHREVEEVPMYALTVAKSGLKLQPMEEGGCNPHDPTRGFLVSEMFPPGQKPLCIIHVGWDGPNWTIDAAGQSLSKLAGALGGAIMDHPVLDKTGNTALFNFNLVLAHSDKTPGVLPVGIPSPFPASDTSSGPSVFIVLEQQLGLTLVPDKGPREYLVIDSAERPAEN